MSELYYKLAFICDILVWLVVPAFLAFLFLKMRNTTPRFLLSSSAKIIDFSPNKRTWGNSFQLITKLDEDGYKWTVGIWCPQSPEEGDIILLGLNHDDIRPAVITKTSACGNPVDMYIVEINIKGACAAYEKLKLQNTFDNDTLERMFQRADEEQV